MCRAHPFLTNELDKAEQRVLSDPPKAIKCKRLILSTTFPLPPEFLLRRSDVQGMSMHIAPLLAKESHWL